MNHANGYRSAQGGATMIEILVVVAIVALIMGISVPMVSGFTAANLRTGAGKVAGAVKYMYDLSSMTGSYCRLKFDLQESGFTAECADKPFFLAKRLQEADLEGKMIEEEEKEERLKVGQDDEEEQAELKKLKPNFREVKTRLLKKSSLPSGIRFDGIMTGHQKEPFTKGAGYMYFFPSGYTERAWIYLANDNGDVFTVVVSSLTGRTVVKAEYVEARD